MKLSIEILQEEARKHRGALLSDIYINNSVKLRWRCESGHKWLANAHAIRSGQWCPTCAGRTPLNIYDMQKIAEERGGKCLSNSYKGQGIALKWQCKKKHIWNAVPGSIRNGKSWCPKCAFERLSDLNRRGSIGEMQKLAKVKGGSCQSKQYIRAHLHLLWRCLKGHEWEATPNNIRRGKWCPICGREKAAETRKKYNLSDLQKFASLKGGESLASGYISYKTKMDWRCKNGHNFQSSWEKVKSGNWCPFCIGRGKTIVDLQRIAAPKYGRCLSKKYLGARHKHLWQCAQKHIWKAVPYSIQAGSWCPECCIGIGERVVREYLQQLFGKQFPKAHPPWLKSSRGTQLELDGFCEELGLAFEHQGRQHYTENSMFSEGRNSLQLRKNLDREKELLCRKNKVELIIFPQLGEILSHEKINEFMRKVLTRKKIPLPSKLTNFRPDYRNAFSDNTLEQFYELKKVVKARGGRLLDKQYLGSTVKVRVRCSKGHEFSSLPGNLKSGKWCRSCAGTIPLTITEMQDVAKDREGKCLSTTYVNNHTHLRWKCKLGHIWKAKPANIKKGDWCPTCGGRRPLTMKDMHDAAKKRKGKCLSTHYIDNRTRLKWQCKLGHVWAAVPMSIRRGSWCKRCAMREFQAKQKEKME